MPPKAASVWSALAFCPLLAFGIACGSHANDVATTADSGAVADSAAPGTASGGAAVVAPGSGGRSGGGGATSPAQAGGSRGTGGGAATDAGSGIILVDASAPDAGNGPSSSDARSPLDAAGSQGGSTGGGDPGASAYTCTLMMGILATEEWYDAGFETMVDNSRWELIFVHSGFIELWANPQDPVWSTATLSPCAQNAAKPDRVVFVALNFDFTTLSQWLPPITAAVNNLKAKYPSAKRIELTSFIRAPGDNPCSQAPAKRSTITPAQDEAMAMVAAANPGLVFVTPKFEAKSCNEFSSNPPHPTPAGATAWAKMMADAYR